MGNNISINLAYFEKENPIGKTLNFQPYEYFEFEDSSEYDVDSVPLYLDLLDYIIDSQNVTKTILTICNYSNGNKLIIETNYWNDQQSRISIRTDFLYDTILDKELILDILLPQIPPIYSKMHNVCRFIIEEGGVKCTYQGIIMDNSDGSETEYRIF